MEFSLSEQEEIALDAIGLQMQMGKDVSFQDQLKFLRWRKETLSKQIKDDPDAYTAHEDILAQIEAINKEIMNSGDRGGGMTGQASVDATHNNPR